MLIKLHEKCFVNPINVAAVICGQMHVTVKLTNGRSHNIECRGNSCDTVFNKIAVDIASYIDMIEVAAKDRTWVNVDHVLSIAGTNPGVTINMAGDWTIIIACGPSSQSAKMAEIVKAMEPFK